MYIVYTPAFARQYKKLSDIVKREAERKEKVFRKNPFNKTLKTHKLHGRLDDCWAFSINPKNRIIFEFKDSGKVVVFHAIGSHDVYI